MASQATLDAPIGTPSAIDYRPDASDPLDAEDVCLVLPVHAGRSLHGPAARLDEASGGYLSSALGRVGQSGERGEALLLLEVPGARAERVLLIGCGARSDIDVRRFASIAAHAAGQIERSGAACVLNCLCGLDVHRRDAPWRVAHLIEAQERERYRFRRLKSAPGEGPDASVYGGAEGASDSASPERDGSEGGGVRRLATMLLPVAAGDELDTALAARTEACAIAAGTRLARDLANLSPDRCTPRTLGEVGLGLQASHASVTTTVLDESELEALGAGALLSVSRGSAEPARLIVVRHVAGYATAEDPPICLVGKGITFDSGGLSLKSMPSMSRMKFDMGGAAAVLGALDACARLALPLHVVAIVAAAENMPGPTATRPGDVVTTLSGRTVEVLNTDAEGRLVLCDALTWAERLGPRAVVDVATLTGACVTALGSTLHGLFANDRTLGRELERAGRRAHDRAWALPLLEEYQEGLDSEVADVANIGGNGAGATVAACFLWRFARTMRWAHLDVAGTASGEGTGSATGRPVPLLVRWLIERAADGGAGDAVG